MKKFKRMFALTATAAMVLSNIPSVYVSAAVTDLPSIDAVNVQEEEALPDWVPSNYIEALNFTNEHGTTYANGDYICVVQNRLKNDRNYYNIDFTKSNPNGDLIIFSNKDLYLEDVDAPEIPDRNTDRKAFDEYMDNYGIYSLDPDGMSAIDYYKVIVFQTAFTDVDVKMESGRYKDGEPNVTDSVTYTFGYKTSMREQEEFDVFRFLPDSTKEFNEFLNIYGNLSIHGDYVVYCGEVNYSTGADLEIENSAPDKLKEIMSYSVIPHYPLGITGPAGTPDKVVKVYNAIDVGDASLGFTLKRSNGSIDTDKSISKNYLISSYEDFNTDTKFKITEQSDSLPDWIPADFDEAMDFDYKYGATHIEDDYVCLVRRIGSYPEEYTEAITDWNYEKHEDSNSQISKKHYEPSAAQTAKSDIRLSYDVEVFKLRPSTIVEVSWNKSQSNNFIFTGGDTCKYVFESDKNGSVKETDIFGWLPDSLNEADEYNKDKGMITVHDNFVVYCNVISAGTGYDMDIKSSGTAKVKEIAKYSYEVPSLQIMDGGGVAKIILYQASKPGTETMTFTFGRSFEPDSKKKKTVQAFRFDNDLIPEMIDVKDLPALISGDCNYDNAVGLSDYVALKKWLQTGSELGCAENADMNKDGVIDVFDLIALKKLLIKGNTVYSGLVSDPKPMLVGLYTNHAWGLQQNISVYDENGVEYSMSLNALSPYYPDSTYDEQIVMSTDRDWYGRLVDIIKNDKAVKSYMPDDLVSKTRNAAANIAEYSKTKGSKSMGMMFDAGITVYYLIGKDANGSPDFMQICTVGDTASVSNSKEIQEYVKYGCYEDFFMSPSQLAMLQKYAEE